MGIKNSSKNKSNKKQKQTSFFGRHKKFLGWVLSIVTALLLIALAIYIAFQVSPWPGALFIRSEFDKGGKEISQALQKHVPAGVAEVQNQQYRPNDKDAYLDVFYPEKTTTLLPTVVWVHGGAWVSGDKDEVDNYLKIVAARGFTVVGVNYSVAPEKRYPTPIFQLNDALKYVQQESKRLNIDTNKIVLAGDSAGSQIVAQMATIITNPIYAKEMDIQPTLAANKLKATLLNCGAYDLDLPNYQGTDGWFLHTVLWAYSGTKNFLSDPNIRHASVVDYVTSAFPPSYITAGNADPLEAQSKEFAKKLTKLGVPTSTLFYSADHNPKLGHEYQFNLDTKDGLNALEQMITFLRAYTK